jgi:hypothetical protein
MHYLSPGLLGISNTKFTASGVRVRELEITHLSPTRDPESAYANR